MNGNFWPTGHVPGVSQEMAIGIGRTKRELPLGQPKPLGKNFTIDASILGWQHECEASSRLLLHCSDSAIWSVATHGTSVT
jgi:hypothetical protein